MKKLVAYLALALLAVPSLALADALPVGADIKTVDVKLYEVQAKGKEVLVTSAVIHAAPNRTTPFSVERESTYVASLKDKAGTVELSPGTVTDGITAQIDRKQDGAPTLAIEVNQLTKLDTPRKEKELGSAQTKAVTTVVPLADGEQEYRFKGDRSTYKVVVNVTNQAAN